jgi:hypothetical protein
MKITHKEILIELIKIIPIGIPLAFAFWAWVAGILLVF